MARVLFVATQFHQGGAERYLFEVCRGLKRAGGREVHVLSCPGVDRQHYYRKLEDLDIPIHQLIPSRFKVRVKYPRAYASSVSRALLEGGSWAPLANRRLRRLFLDFDVISFVQIENYLMLQHCLPREAKAVIHLMSNRFQYDYDVYGRCELGRPYRFVITDHAQREEVGTRIGASAEFVHVPFGMSFEGRPRLKLHSGHPLKIGVFMRLSPERPLEPLFYCFQSLIQRVPATLHVYGAGDPTVFHRTLRMLNIHECVRFEGHVRDLVEAVERDQIGLVWMTTHNGVLGYASIELASLGLPLVAWNLGTERHEAVLGRTDGGLHAFNNVLEFVSFCREAIGDTDRMADIADRLRRHIQREYNITRVVASLAAYYDSVAQDSRAMLTTAD